MFEETPRWPGAPKICTAANLPAFPSWREAEAFLNSISLSDSARWLCGECQHWHFWCGPVPDSIKSSLGILWIIPDSLSSPIGKSRQKVHTHNTSERFFKNRNEENERGAKAELAFEKMTGLKMDLGLYLDGDPHFDFTAQTNKGPITIDVKGAQNPNYLFLKSKDSRHCADILVLAEVLGDRVTFIGWETKEVMRSMPTKDFGFGIVNHYRPAESLRPIRELKDILFP